MKPQFCIGTIKNPTDSDSHAWGKRWSVNCINGWKATLGHKLTTETAIKLHNILVLHEITHVLSEERYCWIKKNVTMSFWDELHKIIHKTIRILENYRISSSFIKKTHKFIHLLSEEIYCSNTVMSKQFFWNEFIEKYVMEVNVFEN